MPLTLQELLARKRASEELAEASHRQRDTAGRRPENEADGVSPAGARSENESPSVPLDSGDEPYGVAQVVTPSGIEIYYQAGPKRLYRIRRGPLLPSSDDEEITSFMPWVEVPSPSKLKDVLDKPALPWWGMETGVAGVLELFERGVLGHNAAGDFPGVYAGATMVDASDVVRLLTENRLTVNHTLKVAQDRGTSVHGALEAWAEKGIVPDPSVYPESERGYVQGLVAFLQDSGVEPVMSEVMVASMEHGYAGRFDLVGAIPDGANIIVKSYPKQKPIWHTFSAADWLIDLKTSKDVYPEHFLQLEHYEKGLNESWLTYTTNRAVLHVTADGRYQLVPNHKWDWKTRTYDWTKPRVTFEDCRKLIDLYHIMERIS